MLLNIVTSVGKWPCFPYRFSDLCSDQRPGKGPADLHPGAPQPGTPRRGHSPGEGGSARTAADEARRSPSEIRAPAHSKLTGI